METRVQAQIYFLTIGAFLLSATGCARVETAASQQFERLIADEWEFRLSESPVFATRCGDYRFNDKLAKVSLADQDRRVARQREFLERLRAIDRSELGGEEQINYDIFERIKNNAIAAYGFSKYLMPITHIDGFQTDFAELPDRVPFDTVRHYEDYIARLGAFNSFAAEHIELMRAGIERGFVLPKVAAKDIERSVKPHIVTDADESLFFKPFEKFPERISEGDRQRLSQAGRDAIMNSVVPGFESLLKFLQDEYVPASRSQISASALPDGKAYYKYLVRYFTTTDLTPEQIHQTGLDEVKRIRAEMMKVIGEVGFDGGFRDFVNFLQSDPRFYVDTEPALVKEVALIAKKVDGELPGLFKRLPRTPFGIKQVPDYLSSEAPGAYYMRSAGDGSRPGFFFINTYDLASRPTYMLEALCLHEAMPGHHLQIALQQELEGLPGFRRFGWFNAYGEGWALYSERLGLEMGLYEDPYSDFGRLLLEMWRACRLVVDTGMHYYGWSRQQAIDYMAEYSALPLQNIVTEVDRYIVWPGQALAYKIGELKIRELREMAEEKLGGDFDVREFHDVVLGGGTIPLDVLEGNVKRWVGEQ